MQDRSDNGRRRLLWLAGEQGWGERWIGEHLTDVDGADCPGDVLWVAESGSPALPVRILGWFVTFMFVSWSYAFSTTAELGVGAAMKLMAKSVGFDV